jgi:peptidyl-prolyl cis-trans isomerase SurA
MLKPWLKLVGLICFLPLAVMAQTPDPVLFTVKGMPVTVSEFTGIYTKTNQDKADFSRASLEEYLTLYTNFKLKVQKARDLQLDTVPALKTELDGYRRQLAASYLVDKEVTDKLVLEAHQRMLQDVEMSHVFVACAKDAAAKDTLIAFQKTMEAYQKLKGGADFGAVAAEFSSDKSAKETMGKVGYVTAMLPDGFYALENYLYTATIGAYSMPLRTNAGYHIVKVTNRRPARGELEVGQILFRKGDTPASAAKAKMRADSSFAALRGGANWDELCKLVSEDKMTAPKGGYIGFFGINRYQSNFEEAAFALENDGEYTAPVETTIGWHLVKRISARPVASFETMKRGLSDRVKRDGRSEVAKQSIISRIQREGKFQEFSAPLSTWGKLQLDSIFHTFKWKPDPAKPQTALFAFGTQNYTLADFEDYCSRASRERMRGKGYPVEETIARLYKAWKDETTLRYEESQLDQKYPEFKSLMREYEGGMLLFEAAKVEVWDRANTDSVGLEQFFNANLKSKYMWDERAKVYIYTLKSDDPKLLKKVLDLAAKKPTAEVLKKINKKGEVLTVLERSYEKGKNKDLDGLWRAGAISAAKTDAGTKTATFSKVEQIAPPTPKALNEARGYAVAEYQDYLEKRWIEQLRQEYPVTINRAVFESLIKK